MALNWVTKSRIFAGIGAGLFVSIVGLFILRLSKRRKATTSDLDNDEGATLPRPPPPTRNSTHDNLLQCASKMSANGIFIEGNDSGDAPNLQLAIILEPQTSQHALCAPPPTRNSTEENLTSSVTRVEEWNNGGQDTLLVVSSHPAKLTMNQAHQLTSLLILATNSQQLIRVLKTIANAGAFSQSQEFLREAGCLEKLVDILQEERGDLVVSNTLTAISNLSMNNNNQIILKPSVPVIAEFLQSADVAVQLACLRVLTNLSVNLDLSPYFGELVQDFYLILDSGSLDVRLQTLKVLANLSSCPDLVLFLLSAKSPLCSIHLLRSAQELVLRWVTVLANLRSALKHNVTLPGVLYLPDSLYTLAQGAELRGALESLKSHPHEDIRLLAARALD